MALRRPFNRRLSTMIHYHKSGTCITVILCWLDLVLHCCVARIRFVIVLIILLLHSKCFCYWCGKSSAIMLDRTTRLNSLVLYLFLAMGSSETYWHANTGSRERRRCALYARIWSCNLVLRPKHLLSSTYLSNFRQIAVTFLLVLIM